MLEMPGIEPGAFHMQSERATTALHPQLSIHFAKKRNRLSMSSFSPYFIGYHNICILFNDYLAHVTFVRSKISLKRRNKGDFSNVMKVTNEETSRGKAFLSAAERRNTLQPTAARSWWM